MKRVSGWMPRLTGFVIGAAVFVAAHALEARHWSDWFNGEYEPWFLNSGRAVLFTLGLLAAASALTAALARSPRPVGGLAICSGAFVAMAVVLFAGRNPGTLFPITRLWGYGAVLQHHRRHQGGCCDQRRAGEVAAARDRRSMW